MPNVYITFDYELFFGTSGTPVRCIFAPTDRLRPLLRDSGIRATFFVDTLYYRRLAANDATRADAERMREQLTALAAEGHALGLHLHPHWLDATYAAPHWAFPSYDRYRLDALSCDAVTALFVEGAAQLNQIYHAAGRDDTIDAFRAGGWCVQPFAKLAEGFRQVGITIDSSVGHGMCSHGAHHAFDFRTAPASDLYRFSTAPTRAEPDGPFWELPLTTFRPRLAHKLKREWLRRTRPADYRISGDGDGLRYASSGRSLCRDAITSAPRFLSLDGEPAHLLVASVRALAQDHVVICGHTKCYAPAMAEGLRQLAALDTLRFPVINAATIAAAARGAGGTT
jgi:hypothetical protein